MPRPNFPNFMPKVHVAATRAGLDGTAYGDPPGTTVNTQSFLLGEPEELHRCLNRISRWSIDIGIRADCPDTTYGEYQTMVVHLDWARTAYFIDEDTLHIDPQLLTTAGTPGRDLFVIEEPVSGTLFGTNVLSAYDSDGLISTSHGFLNFFFQAFLYVGSWATGRGGVMLNVNVAGVPWTHTPDIDPFIASSTDGITGLNQLQFDGDSPTDFQIIGDLTGGTSTLSNFGQLYTVIMKPTLWYPYEKDLVAKFDTLTGEVI